MSEFIIEKKEKQSKSFVPVKLDTFISFKSCRVSAWIFQKGLLSTFCSIEFKNSFLHTSNWGESSVRVWKMSWNYWFFIKLKDFLQVLHKWKSRMFKFFGRFSRSFWFFFQQKLFTSVCCSFCSNVLLLYCSFCLSVVQLALI